MPTPRWTFGPVYSVNLVSPPAHLLDKKAVTSISGDILRMDSGNNSVVLRKDVKRISFPPITRITSLKKSASPERSITRKVGEAGDMGRRVSSSANASGTTIQKRNAEMSMNMRVYYSTVWSMIKGKWALPRGIVPDDNIEAVLSAKILRNGVAADFSFEKRSGNRYFDESAMRAIKKASPFPPLPEWIKAKSIEVGLRFHSSELR
jgi:TonB family C-terminal domain